MMRSMTGFGAGRATDGVRVFTVEARSVNHRYCDVRVHVPHDLAAMESPIEAKVRARVERGRVDVTVQVAHSADAVVAPEIDMARARGYRDALYKLATDLGVEPVVTLQMIASAPGVVGAPSPRGPAADVDGLIASAVEEAVSALLVMREREGRALEKELVERRASVLRLTAEIRTAVPVVVQERRAKLEQRLAELLGDRTLEPARVAQEVAILADRTDVTEELTRLESHLSQLDVLFRSNETVGRKLDFLLQEMNREANTIGSKTMNASISYGVVELKAELERMREQVQNVE